MIQIPRRHIGDGRKLKEGYIVHLILIAEAHTGWQRGII